ncbi:hypothetical protein DFR30_2792 [Thiogranum longum]|uniref:Ig-like domain-containing protein n=1 Tax=Thiogranum longum TaxID=1537524 RepID=A0A4R1HFC7_9GAMM|nr:hypothetical protein [Thiogranum longum]TCK19481.1 hypothetical protein DFR30_2792 [Thiogranum longum]
MIKDFGRRAFIKKTLTLLSGLSMYGCGGGSGSSGTTPAPSPTPAPTPPAFLVHPSDQTAVKGDIATFETLASGAEPLFYQWQRNGLDIPGATGLTYTTSPTALGDDAVFSVIATNSAGSVTSLDAQLTVLPPKITADSTSVTVDSTLLTVDNSLI